MKRTKKLLINCSIIAIILFSFYYFGGFYISKEQCVIETVRALYGNETETIMEFQNKNSLITLMANTKEKTFSLVGTKKIGFLYRTASSSVGQKINEDELIEISGLFSSEIGMVIIVYRNDPSIHKIEVVFGNGDTMILEKWESDFVGFMLDSDNWQSATYKAYDIDNQLIDEIYY